MKQAFREWYSKLSSVLLTRGYVLSKNDPSLFYKKEGDYVVFMAVYVDDILVVGNNTSKISSIKACLDSFFRIKDLGNLHYFLGLKFNKILDGMIISQRKFTLDLLTEFNCLEFPPVVSPWDSG